MMGVAQVQVPEVEADDVIGILCQSCVLSKWTPVVYSSDKDFMQLICRGAVVIRDVDKLRKLKPENKKSVFKKFGCSHEDVIKVRAISGDASDGIPNAVRGIGPKTAVKILELGIDPTKPRTCVVPIGTPAKHPAWKMVEAWEQVHRNYRLMRIPSSYQDAVFSTVKQRELGSLLVPLLTSLSIRQRKGWDRYVQFIQTLAKLDLYEAMDERVRLWSM